MKIVVTVKQVPDPNSSHVLESDNTLARDKEVVLDPGDECGVEEGLQLKEAHGGEVILKGSVRSWSEREEAERVAWMAPGVTRVLDRITVSP